MSCKKPCPSILVRPCRTIVDDKFVVLVEQLPPGQTVTIHSLLHSEDDDYWEAFGHYISDDKGVVNGKVV